MDNTIYDGDFMYYVFCIGYDEYIRKLANISSDACDWAFEDAIKITREFWDSEENKQNKSGYDCLIDYLERKAEEGVKNER